VSAWKREENSEVIEAGSGKWEEILDLKRGRERYSEEMSGHEREREREGGRERERESLDDASLLNKEDCWEFAYLPHVTCAH
jgi:hypothetical protein